MYLLPMKIGLILRLTWWSLFDRVKHSRFVKMSFRTNSQFLGASVNEFIQVWALGGDASLNLSTRGGLTTVAFNCTIGQPGAPHSHAPFSALPSHLTLVLLLLTGHATVVLLRRKETDSELPATGLLKCLHQNYLLFLWNLLHLLIQRQFLPLLYQWQPLLLLIQWHQLLK